MFRKLELIPEREREALLKSFFVGPHTITVGGFLCNRTITKYEIFSWSKWFRVFDFNRDLYATREEAEAALPAFIRKLRKELNRTSPKRKRR